MTDAYEKYCVGCWREKLCHEDMEFCDEYMAAVEKEAGEDE